MTASTAEAASSPMAVAAAVEALPVPDVWVAAAAHHDELFAPLDPGVRIALLPRAAPTQMLVWEASETDVEARIEPFAGYAASGADIALAADDEWLLEIRSAGAERLFEVLRAGIRSGHIVCYLLRRRCVLEERGLDEMLDALGFAFMGACR